MAETMTGVATSALSRSQTAAGSGSRDAYRVLRLAFTIAPIVAGADKFLNLLTDWSRYLPGVVAGVLGENAGMAMMAIGVVEIVAGIGVALRPRIFAWVVAAWLLLIVIALLLIPGYYDVALRDVGLMLGAVALGRLAAEYDR